MANNFATLKLNQQSNKFFLVRLNPARAITSDLTLDSGTTYTATFAFGNMNALKVDGTAYTKVTGTPSASEFAFNESTKVVTVNLGAALTTQQVIAFYYLFYTSDRTRVIGEDPETPATDERNWEPRIVTSPTAQSSIEDVVEGTLSVSTSGLSLINNDNEFEQFIGDNDSFNRKKVQIWSVIDDIENIQKVYDGTIRAIDMPAERVNFTFDDPLSPLLDRAYMGDDKDEVFFNTDGFPNVDPNKKGRPVRYFIGKTSRYSTIFDDTVASGVTDAQILDPDGMEEAVCTGISSTISTSTNREWGIGRVHDDGFLDFSFTPSAIDQTDANFTKLTGTAGEIGKFNVGDTFVIDQSGTPFYARVVGPVASGDTDLFLEKVAGPATNDDVEANDCPSIVITDFDNNRFYPLYERDYTTTVTATSGGNKYLKITFTNNFETNHAGLTNLDPGNNKVFFRVKPDTTNAKHSDALKDIIEKTGITTNASSFTTAGTTLTTELAMSIPFLDQSNYSGYIRYVEEILESTLGYLFLNNSFEVGYALFDAPSSTDEVTDTDILLNSLSKKIDYKDIAQTVTTFNPHFNSFEQTDDSNNTTTITQTNTKARFLHETEEIFTFRHVLAKMNDRIAAILNLRSERRATYTFSTNIRNIDNIIGDDLQLTNDDILGTDSSKDLTIIAIGKNPRRTTISATDLLGL